MTVRINMISGPRNISSAMMYSFRSRSDTTVYDEPLYGNYLAVTGIDHPGRDQTLATEPTNGEDAVRDIIFGKYDTPLVFLKNMAHHIFDVGLDLSFLDDLTNFFLVRDPHDVLTSMLRNLPNPTPNMTGLPQQARLLDRSLAMGQEPIVLCSKNILLDPPGQLQMLCDRIGIPWDSAMLSWPAGPKPEDGSWAPYWYTRLHSSTGFAPFRQKGEELPDRLSDVLGQCRAAFDEFAPYVLE